MRGVEAGQRFDIWTKEQLYKEGITLDQLKKGASAVNLANNWKMHITENMIRISDLCLFAIQEGKIVGYSIANIYKRSDNQDLAEVNFLATAIKAQGLGTDLFQETMCIAKSKGCSELRLTPTYASLGFYTTFADRQRMQLQRHTLLGCWTYRLTYKL